MESLESTFNESDAVNRREYYDYLIKNDINKFLYLVDKQQVEMSLLTKKQRLIIQKRRQKMHIKENKYTFKTLWMFIRNYKKLLLWALFFALINVLLNALATFGMQSLTELISDSQVSHSNGDMTINWHNFRIMCAYAGTLFAFCIALSIALWYETKFIIIVSQRVGYDIRQALFKKIHSIPAKYFDNHKSGDMISCFTHDINSITNGLSQNAGIILSGVLTSLSMLISMFLMSSYLALITIGLIPLLIIPVLYMTKKSQPLFKKTQESVGKMNSFIEETIFNQDLISSFNLEKKTVNDFSKLNNKLNYSAKHSQAISSLIFPFTNFFVNCLNFFITFIGLIFVIKGIPFGGIDISSTIKGVQVTAQQVTHHNLGLYNQYINGIAIVAAFTLMAGGFMGPFSQVGNIMNMLQATMAGATHAFGLLKAKDGLSDFEHFILNIVDKKAKVIQKEHIPESTIYSLAPTWSKTGVDEGDKEPEKELYNSTGDIKFKNVTFRNVEGELLLDDCSFTIRAHQNVFIYDKKGFSKRSIAELLIKLYEPEKGSILIGNKRMALSEITKQSVRDNVILTYRDGFLSNGTIKENLMLLNKHVSFETIVDVCQKLQLHNWIMSLKDGYDTMVEEGGDEFSLGQKQLLSVARCLLKPNSILILDETLSELDPQSYHLVKEAIDKIAKERTVIYLTHKIEDTLHEKNIIVLDGGKVIQSGSYDQLKLEEGFYKSNLNK